MAVTKQYGTKRTRLTISLACVGALLATADANALTKTWNNTSTDFNTPGNWTGGTPGAGDTAEFTGAAVTQPNLSSSVTIANLYLSSSNAAGYQLTSTNASTKLTLSSTSATAGARAIDAVNTSGTNTIDAPIVFYANLPNASANSNIQTISQANGGSLVINGAVTLPSTNDAFGSPNGALVLSSGSTGGITINGLLLTRGGGSNSAGNLVNAAGNNTVSNFGFFNNGGTRVAVTAGSLTITNNIPVSGGGTTPIRLLGSGTLQLDGNNVGIASFSIGDAANVHAPVIKIGNKGALGAGNVTFDAGTTATLQSKDATSFTGANLIANNLVLNSTSATGVTFGAANTGDLQFGGTVAMGAASKIVVNNATTTFGGIVSGGFSLTKNGTGTLTLLNATNTYTGATSITAGRLKVDGTGTINATSGITISGGELAYNSSTALTKSINILSGTVSGTGTVTGITADSSSETVAPGSTSAALTNGKLTVNGNFSLSGGGKLAMDVSKRPTNLTLNAQVAGLDYDQVAVTTTNTVNLTGGTLALTLDPSVLVNDVFYLVDNQSANAITGRITSGSINGLAATITTIDANSATIAMGGYYSFTLNYVASAASGGGNDLSLTANAVPEPASAGVIGLLAVGLMRRRRRTAGL